MTFAFIDSYRLASSGFVPTDISGCAGWWDASDSSTITHSSGAVSQWDDKSGNARHLSQATASKKPTTNASTLNGLNVIDFDRSGPEYVSRSSAPGPVLQGADGTVFIVCETENAISAIQVPYSETSASNLDDQWTAGLLSNGDPYVQHSNPSTSAISDSNTQVDDGGAHILIYGDSSSAIWHRVDGADTAQHYRSSPKTYTQSGTYGAGRINIGALWRLSTPGFGWGHSIAEVIVYDTELSTGDVSTVEDYLNDKWAVYP